MMARRGRPPLPPEEGKRYSLGIRTTKELRDQLVRASAASGRSIAQEIEFRLEMSLRADPLQALVQRLERVLPVQEAAPVKTVTCLQCDKPFECGPGRGRQASAKFCCDQHRIDFNSALRTPARPRP